MCLFSDNTKEDDCTFDHHCSTKAGDKSNKTIDHTDINITGNTSQDHVSRRSKSDKAQQQTSGKTQHQCKVCERYFDNKWKQQCHMWIHSSEKSFQCKVCNKGFAQSQNHKIHMHIHTGEKPYQCKVCDTCFFPFSKPKASHQHSHRKPTI